MVKNLPANAGDQEMQFQFLGQEDPLEEEMATLQCCCQDNPMDREAWRATVHGVSKSRTCLSTCACTQ